MFPSIKDIKKRHKNKISWYKNITYQSGYYYIDLLEDNNKEITISKSDKSNSNKKIYLPWYSNIYIYHGKYISVETIGNGRTLNYGIHVFEIDKCKNKATLTRILT